MPVTHRKFPSGESFTRDDAHVNSRSCTSSTRRPYSASLRSFLLFFSESHLGASLPLVTWYTFTPLGAETRNPEYSPADIAGRAEAKAAGRRTKSQRRRRPRGIPEASETRAEIGKRMSDRCDRPAASRGLLCTKFFPACRVIALTSSVYASAHAPVDTLADLLVHARAHSVRGPLDSRSCPRAASSRAPS